MDFFFCWCRLVKIELLIRMDDPNERLLFESDHEEEEFRSCLAEEEDWKETVGEVPESDRDELEVRLFFKGVSAQEPDSSGSRVSGIGVVMEKPAGVVAHKAQKRLDFVVDEAVAEHLALMDGLLEALRNDERRMLAFTDSEIVYEQASS